MHKHAVEFLADMKSKFNPDQIVCLGDEADQHALGDWDHDPDGMSAGDEHKAMIAQLKPLYKIFPEVKVCESNHSKRPYRKAFKSGLPRAYMKAYREFMEAPYGWSWHDTIEIEKVLYMHGEGYSGPAGALKAAMSNRKSVFIGHLHSFAGVQYSATRGDQIFGVNSGCLIDEEKYAFAYGKIFPNRAVLGCSICVHGTAAQFIPMV
jgi:hypothetical protein